LKNKRKKKVTTKGISNSKKKVIKNIYFETKLKKREKQIAPHYVWNIFTWEV
jgi:hypothetical protein